jgi:O-antigen ligase
MLFHFFGIIKLSFFRLFSKFALIMGMIFSGLWVTNKELITDGFLKFFYSGLSHGSILIRWKGIVDCWNIFLDHPWLGVGLGALPFCIAQKELGTPLDLLDKTIPTDYAPTNATLEIFASLGIIGIILFAAFLYLMVHTFRSGLKIPQLEESERIHLIAFAISICVMIAVLQFNQSIMRPYVWVHVGMFVGYVQALKRCSNCSKRMLAS